MEIISRAEAKERGLNYYFTGKPCANGHISKRRLSNKMCCSCTKIHNENSQHAVDWQKKNRDRHLNYIADNRAKVNAKRRETSAKRQAERALDRRFDEYMAAMEAEAMEAGE